MIIIVKKIDEPKYSSKYDKQSSVYLIILKYNLDIKFLENYFLGYD